MVRKMGPLSKIFGMLPGMGEIKDQISNIDEREVDRIEAIIHSMTPAERDNPKIIDGSRRARIAKGSGVEVLRCQRPGQPVLRGAQDDELAGHGKMPGIPGLPGARKQPARQRRRRRRVAAASPAIRPAATRAQPTARDSQPSDFDPAAAFGAGEEVDQEALAKAMAEFQLPPGCAAGSASSTRRWAASICRAMSCRPASRRISGWSTA